jgi:hypothetical protein
MLNKLVAFALLAAASAYAADHAPEWRNVRGKKIDVYHHESAEEIWGAKIIQVIGPGCYLANRPAGFDSRVFMVTNLNKSFIDGDHPSTFQAVYVDDVSYLSVENSRKTVRLFDCGVPWEPTLEEIQAASRAILREKEQRQKSAQKAQSNVVPFLLVQASNGMPSAQCSLGKRYLTGEGIEKNLILARYWLEKSAAQDNPEAKEALKRLAP